MYKYSTFWGNLPFLLQLPFPSQYAFYIFCLHLIISLSEFYYLDVTSQLGNQLNI